MMLAAVGSTGCLRPVDAIRLTGAILEVTAHVAVAAATSGRGREVRESSACCYTRENPTPVDEPVYRSMTECELSRGRRSPQPRPHAR
jgi:hypothetical protein